MAWQSSAEGNLKFSLPPFTHFPKDANESGSEMLLYQDERANKIWIIKLIVSSGNAVL